MFNMAVFTFMGHMSKSSQMQYSISLNHKNIPNGFTYNTTHHYLGIALFTTGQVFF